MERLPEVKINSVGIEFILDTKLDLAAITEDIVKAEMHFLNAKNQEAIWTAEITDTTKLRYVTTGAADFANLGRHKIVTYIETDDGGEYWGETYEFDVVEKYHSL